MHSPAVSDPTFAWLRLSLVPGIGPRIGRELAAVCGSVTRLWGSGPEAWTKIEGVGPRLARALAAVQPEQARRVACECEQAGLQLVSLDDELYPPQLRALEDAPLVLFIKGDAEALRFPRLLAVVGSRRSSHEGRLLARRWCRAFSKREIGIVSGMAYGIDAAAHRGAMEGDAPTLAVLGCGLAFPLAPEQMRLLDAIAAHGCAISEFLPSTEPFPGNFPRRNRIIAGLAAAVLVVEAGIKSGSLITARLAAECGREVLAVPGPVLGGRHGGCHQLIRDGAQLVESTQDVLRTLGWQAATGEGTGKAAHSATSENEARIMQALAQEVLHTDALAASCGLTVSELSPILLGLELLGVVERLPGGRYALKNGGA